MEDGAILPLRSLGTDPGSWYLVYLDAVVSGPYQSDGDPTTYIPEFTVVGLSPLGGDADGQALQHGLRLSSQKAFN